MKIEKPVLPTSPQRGGSRGRERERKQLEGAEGEKDIQQQAAAAAAAAGEEKS
jgi:hypothetical protein